MEIKAPPEKFTTRRYTDVLGVNYSYTITAKGTGPQDRTGSPDWGGCLTGPPVGGVTSTSTPALWPCAVLWPCTFCSDRSNSLSLAS